MTARAETLRGLGIDSEAEKIRRWLDPLTGPPPELRAALEEGEKELRRATSSDGRVALLKTLVGLARFREASEVFGGASAPPDAVPWIVEADIQLGQLDVALRRLRDLPIEGRPDWALLCLGALARLASGDIEGAAVWLRSATSAEGGEAVGRALAALVAQQRGDAEAAWASACEAAALRPGAGWPLAIRALLSQARQDFKGAVGDLDAAAAREPLAWIYKQRAVCHEKAGNMEAALDDADLALSLSLPHASLHVQKGHLLLHRKKYAAAIAEFSRAVLLAPQDAEPRWRRANAFWLDGRLDLAADDAQTCATLVPDSLEYRMGEVRFAILRGEYARARAQLRRWLRSGTADLVTAARFLSAGIHFRNGRFRCAAADFDKAELMVRSGQASRKFLDVGYGNVARAMRHLKDKGVCMSRLGVGKDAEVPAGPPVLILSGLGLSYPMQATLEVMNVLSGCDTVFSNLAGSDAMEFLSLFCPDVRTVSYEGKFDEDTWVDKVFSAMSPGRTVAFVTRGHPLVSGKLASELLVRARREGVEVRSYGAISTVDSIIALAEEVLSVSFWGLQVFDSRLITGGKAVIQVELPMIMYLGIEYAAAPKRVGAYVQEIVRLLRALYPAGHGFFLHGPRYDSRTLDPVALEGLEARLSGVAPDMLSSIILFAPPVTKPFPPELPGGRPAAAAAS